MVPFSFPSPQQQLESLQRELYARNRQLAEAEEALRQERAKNAAVESGVRDLRRVLSPLYQALGQVFGEMEGMGMVAATTSADPRKQAIWESWKAKLPSGEAKAIDALLLHGTMTTAQLRIHVGCASRTAQNIVTALKSKGLIVKNGHQISLKEL
jgi:hypothetical protein